MKMYIHPVLFGLLKFCRVCKDLSLFASAKCTQTPSVVTSEHTLDWFEDENKKENKTTAQHSSVSLGIFAISQENSPSRLLKCMKHIHYQFVVFSPFLLSFILSCGLWGNSHCILGKPPLWDVVCTLYVLQHRVLVVMQISIWNCISLSVSDTCTCCLFSCIMHITEAFLWLLLLLFLLNP